MQTSTDFDARPSRTPGTPGTPARILLAAGLALSAMVAPALARQDEGRKEAAERQLEGSFDQPLDGQAKREGARGERPQGRQPNQGQSRQTTIITKTGEDGKTYTFRMEDGKVSGDLDGKKLPPERVRVSGDDATGKTAEIVDENGKIVFSVPLGGRQNGNWNRQWQEFAGKLNREMPGQPRVQIRQFPNMGGQQLRALEGGEAEVAPPVMIGITMSDADQALLKHLSLEGIERAILVETVLEDQPAAKAGILPYDLIVSINGKTPATPELLRDTLRGMKAGDELSLKVVRKGQNQDVTLKVAERPKQEGEPQIRTFQNDEQEAAGENGRWFDESRAAIERALESLRADPALQPDKIREQATRALEEARKALGEARERVGQHFNAWMAPEAPDAPGEPGQPGVMFFGPNQDQVFRVPGMSGLMGGAMGGAITQKVESLDRKLADIDKKLEALDRRLDDLNKSLEKK
jgi:hypothetical protein